MRVRFSVLTVELLLQQLRFLSCIFVLKETQELLSFFWEDNLHMFDVLNFCASFQKLLHYFQFNELDSLKIYLSMNIQVLKDISETRSFLEIYFTYNGIFLLYFIFDLKFYSHQIDFIFSFLVSKCIWNKESPKFEGEFLKTIYTYVFLFGLLYNLPKHLDPIVRLMNLDSTKQFIFR